MILSNTTQKRKQPNKSKSKKKYFNQDKRQNKRLLYIN